MSDQRGKLKSLFEENHRYTNFGSVIESIQIHGFRCHSDTVLEITCPITAFCGLNGTGKSTILHLLSSAYKKTDGVDRYHVSSFFAKGTLDPNPYTPDAFAEFKYCSDGKSKTIKLHRSSSQRGWGGYRSQPERQVYFAGMGLYLPKAETRDFVFKNASKLQLSETLQLTNRAKHWIIRILNCGYDTVTTSIVSHNNKNSDVSTAMQNGAQYSEANMGCGEGRIHHIIKKIESLPEKSLILLEEPETSLHPSAQFHFSQYLIDVCIEKRHQVFMTTHSEYLLKALPSSSAIYLDKFRAGIIPYYGISPKHATSLMTNGREKASVILVEDDVGEAVVTELLRKHDPQFLKTTKVCIGGDTKTIHSTMVNLKNTGLPVVAVRDADKEGDTSKNILKLPGNEPPEKELLLKCEAVKEHFRTKYHIEINTFATVNAGVNHHEWFGKLADDVCMKKEVLIQEIAAIYSQSISETIAVPLVRSIKDSVSL
jgi:predicted ATP-dependent endonuclease of OLD family